MSFYDLVLAKDPLFHTTKQVADIAMLEPVTRAAVQAILADAKALGKDLRLLETYRSKERQHVLYQNGATKLQKVGCHHYGVAADFALYVGGQYIKDGNQYNFIGPLAKKHGLIWGGEWKMRDCAHVQRIALKDQNRLFAGLFYPDASYLPRPVVA